MKKFLVLVLIAFYSLNIWAQSIKTGDQSAQKEKTKVSDEEYKIYTLVLPKDKQEFVIRDKTASDKISLNTKKSYIKEIFKELDEETFEDFKIKNNEPAQLEKNFTTLDNYILITLNELKESFVYEYESQMNWEKFYISYPKTKAIYTFSRAGFNKDGNQALVFVTFWCRYLCGEGNFYFLKKENGEWKTVLKLDRWIS